MIWHLILKPLLWGLIRLVSGREPSDIDWDHGPALWIAVAAITIPALVLVVLATLST